MAGFLQAFQTGIRFTVDDTGSSMMDEQQSFPIMDLPREMRDELYGHVLANGTMAILCVSKQVNIEAARLVKANASLRLDETYLWRCACRMSSPSGEIPSWLWNLDTSCIKHVTLRIDLAKCKPTRDNGPKFPMYLFRASDPRVAELIFEVVLVNPHIFLSTKRWVLGAISRIECKAMFISWAFYDTSRRIPLVPPCGKPLDHGLIDNVLSARFGKCVYGDLLGKGNPYMEYNPHAYQVSQRHSEE